MNALERRLSYNLDLLEGNNSDLQVELHGEYSPNDAKSLDQNFRAAALANLPDLVLDPFETRGCGLVRVDGHSVLYRIAHYDRTFDEPHRFGSNPFPRKSVLRLRLI